MSISRRSFLRGAAASASLPFLVGCEGFVEGLDLSAEGQGTGFTGGHFVKLFLRYQVVPVSLDLEYLGEVPVVTPMILTALKEEQSKLRELATEAQQEAIPKVRQDAVAARERAGRIRVHEVRVRHTESEPRDLGVVSQPEAFAGPDLVDLKRRERAELQEAAQLEAQAVSMEEKARQLLQAVDSEIGTIFSQDALHAVHIPTGQLTNTVYRPDAEVTARDEMVVESDEGIFPVVEG